MGALGRLRKDGAVSARVHANTGPAELGHIDEVHVLEPDLEGTRAKLRTLGCQWMGGDSFAGRWGWVIQGCSGLFQSTNQWGSQRDEGRLFEEN